MSVFGLHHSLFFLHKDIPNEEIDMARANLLEIIEHAKMHSAKFLYNEMLDWIQVDDYFSLLSQSGKDPATLPFILNRPMEVFECTYETEEPDFVLIDKQIDLYLIATYSKLKKDYAHNLIFSKLFFSTSEHLEDYRLFKDFDENNFSVNLLPSISSYDGFKSQFALYHWFYSRRGKHEIMTIDSFCSRVSRVNNLQDILTSMFRGIYYPEYTLHQGREPSVHDIDAHRDNKQLVKINNGAQTTKITLYRVNVVPYNIKKDGVLRIGYCIYNDIYIVFCYDDSHCDNMNGFLDKEFFLNNKKHTLSIVKNK